MADFLILAFLIGAPVWLISQFVKARPDIDKKGRSFNPMTGCLYPPEQDPARNGSRVR